MKKFFLVTALLFPLYSFAQTVEDNKETVTEDDIIYNENGNYYDAEGNYLVDYDGQDDKEKKGIKYNPVFRKYIEGSEDLDFYRPRNIEGASAQLAEETRRNHWLGRYIYNYDDPNPNEIRPETDPIINSGENEDNAILFNKKRDWLYYDCQIPGTYFEYRLSPKLRLQDSFNMTRFCDRYRKSLLYANRQSAAKQTIRYVRENAIPFIEYEKGNSDYRLDDEVSGRDKLLKLYGLR